MSVIYPSTKGGFILKMFKHKSHEAFMFCEETEAVKDTPAFQHKKIK